MRPIYQLLLAACCMAQLGPYGRCLAQADMPLRPILINGRWGFYDQGGAIRIQPRFRSAGPFSQGLAAVRESGRWGYIDTSGAWRIQPRFDYAERFPADSVARAYVNGRPYLIDPHGRTLFEHSYISLSPAGLAHGWIAGNTHGLYGVVSSAGKVLIPFAFSRLDTFCNGAAYVEGPRHHPDRSRYDDDTVDIHEVGVVDFSGRMIIPFGRFNMIAAIGHGFFFRRAFRADCV